MRRVDGTQLRALWRRRPHEQGVHVGGQHKAVGFSQQGLQLGSSEVPDFDPPRRVLVPAATMRTSDRQGRPHHLALGHASDLTVAAFGYRERGDAPRQALGLDRRPCAGRRFVGRAFAVFPGAALQAPRRGFEGRRATSLQGDQIGPGRARKAQLELHAVVDRIEGSHREEIQVLALGVEGRGVVAKLGLGGQQGAPRTRRPNLAQLDRGVARAAGIGVGEPAAAGRPDRVFDAAEGAVVDAVDRAAGDIANPEFVAVVGHREPAALRRGAQGRDATEHVGSPGQDARAAALVGFDALLSRRIAGRDQGLAIGQPLAQAAAGRRSALLTHRAFPQGHRVQLAPYLQRQAVTLGMQGGALQMLGCRHESAGGLRAAAWHLDVDAPAAIGPWLVQPKLGAALIRDALSVTAGMAGVEIRVVAVAAHRAAIGLAGVEVAHAFAVANEVDAAAEPHRAREVAAQLRQAGELAALGFIFDPQMARGAAAVSLPARRVHRVAADDPATLWPIGEMVDVAQRNSLGQSAVNGQRVGVPVAKEGLAVIAAKDDSSISCPAPHGQIAAHPGQAPRGAAGGGHQPDFAVLFVSPGVGQPAAIGRQAGRGRLGHAGRQALRDATLGAHVPEVVIADEDQVLALQRGLAQIGRRKRVGWHGNRSSSG